MDINSKEAKLRFKTTAIRSSGLMLVNLLFIAEFSLDGENIWHLLALCCFSLSVPLLLPSILLNSFYEMGDRFEKSSRAWGLGSTHTVAGLLTGIGVGLCITSIHFIGTIAYLLGLAVAFQLFRVVFGLSSNESSDDA